MPDPTVGRGARIERALLVTDTRVGEGAVVGGGARSDDPALEWLSGLTLVGKDAVIPDGARIASQVVVGVGAVPGDFVAGVCRLNASPTARPSAIWYERTPVFVLAGGLRVAAVPAAGAAAPNRGCVRRQVPTIDSHAVQLRELGGV